MRILILAAIVFLATGQALAEPARDALADIFKCADIADPTRRLECFDAATTRAKGALAAPAQPVQQAQPAKEKSMLDWFGFPKSQPVTRTEDFGKPAPEPGPNEVTEVSATVLEFAKTARGKAVFILENGQVWRQIDGDGVDVYAPPQGVKLKVTIETGVFGSYNLTIDGRKGLVKVTRLK